MKTKLKIVEILFDGNRGQYIPQCFANDCNPENSYWVYSLDDAAILREGPDHENYWDAWNDVLDNAYYMDPENGIKYFLYQDDDLFAIREGYTINERGQCINIETEEVIDL